MQVWMLYSEAREREDVEGLQEILGEVNVEGEVCGEEEGEERYGSDDREQRVIFVHVRVSCTSLHSALERVISLL